MRRILIAATAAAAAFAITQGVPTPAFAAHVGPAGYVSFWDGCPVGYCGAAWPIPSANIGSCHSVPTGANDRFTGMDNNTGRNISVWTGGSCTGGRATLYAGTMTGQLGSGFNNTISSYS
jgi:hypothetical protein